MLEASDSILNSIVNKKKKSNNERFNYFFLSIIKNLDEFGSFNDFHELQPYELFLGIDWLLTLIIETPNWDNCPVNNYFRHIELLNCDKRINVR
jgi:hypothetical protein